MNAPRATPGKVITFLKASCKSEAALPPLRAEFATLTEELGGAQTPDEAKAAIGKMRKKLEEVLGTPGNDLLRRAAQAQDESSFAQSYWKGGVTSERPNQSAEKLPQLYWLLAREDAFLDETRLPEMQQTAQRCHAVLAVSKNKFDSEQKIKTVLLNLRKDNRPAPIIIKELQDIAEQNPELITAPSLQEILFIASWRCPKLRSEPAVRKFIIELLEVHLPRLLPACVPFHVIGILRSLSLLGINPRNEIEMLAQRLKELFAQGEECRTKDARHAIAAMTILRYQDVELKDMLFGVMPPDERRNFARNERPIAKRQQQRATDETSQRIQSLYGAPGDKILEGVSDILQNGIVTLEVAVDICELLERNFRSESEECQAVIARMLTVLPPLIKGRIQTNQIANFMLFAARFCKDCPPPWIHDLLTCTNDNMKFFSPMRTAAVLYASATLGHGRHPCLLPLRDKARRFLMDQPINPIDLNRLAQFHRITGLLPEVALQRERN